MKKQLLLLNLFLTSCLAMADYSKSYAVVVSKDTYKSPEWKKVVQTLQKKHQAQVVTYDKVPEEVLPKLQTVFPKYTCFVMKPEETGREVVVRLHQMVRKLDSDIYADTIHGIITGYTPEDALRIAAATKPRVASTAVISAGVGAARFKEAGYLSTGNKGEYGYKAPNKTVVKKQFEGTDMTSIFIDYLDRIDPDIIITSAHASQYGLEMPFSMGNVICKDGKVFGKLTKGKRMIGADGQALKKKVEGELILIKEPKRPKVYFSPGNCLIGDIPQRECMALAWMGWGKANQYIGYTSTTWYGKVGWGAVSYWENMAGKAPLNESLYFSKQNLLYKLNTQFPKTADILIDPKLEPDTKLIRDEIVKRSVEANHDMFNNVGMIWDRDTVAFYGDPALRIVHDINNTIPAKCSVKLSKNKNNSYKFTITAETDLSAPTKNTTPVAAFFPHRLKNIKVVKGAEFKPVITDNFIMVTAYGPLKSGESCEVVFTAQPIKKKDKTSINLSQFNTKPERQAAEFLLKHMPKERLNDINPNSFKENIRYALLARKRFSWAKNLPTELFLNDVLPAINITETSDNWRADFYKTFGTLVKDCKTAEEAAILINKNIQDILKVKYSTARKKADQNVTESMESGIASCSGLSILLVNAFRSVGIPARVAGVPLWPTKNGNHNWVELYVDGEWKFTEYNMDEKGFNHSWFLNDTAYADPEREKYRVYAVSFQKTGSHFPLIWDWENKNIQAVDRTDFYKKLGEKQLKSDENHQSVAIVIKENSKRLAERVQIYQNDRHILTGQTKGESHDVNDMLQFSLKIGQNYTVKYKNETKTFTVTKDKKVQVVEFRL